MPGADHRPGLGRPNAGTPRVLTHELAVDTATPQAEMMANITGTFAQFERRLMSQHTCDALTVLRAPGNRLGRPVELPEATRRRVME